MPNQALPRRSAQPNCRGNRPSLAGARDTSAVTRVQPMSAPNPEVAASAATSFPAQAPCGKIVSKALTNGAPLPTSARWETRPMTAADTARYTIAAAPVPNDLQLWKLLEGREVESGLGEEALEQAGLVLHPPQPRLDQCGQLIDILLDQVGQRPFQDRPDRLDRVELGRIRREPVDGQPVPGRDQLPHRPAGVRVQPVPDHHERGRAAGARRPGTGRSPSR